MVLRLLPIVLAAHLPRALETFQPPSPHGGRDVDEDEEELAADHRPMVVCSSFIGQLAGISQFKQNGATSFLKAGQC